jgi:hypothetical protein
VEPSGSNIGNALSAALTASSKTSNQGANVADGLFAIADAIESLAKAIDGIHTSINDNSGPLVLGRVIDKLARATRGS